MLKRKIWSKLEDFKANADQKTLLLTGARQVGKTYIVEQFAKARYKSFVEINFVEDAAAKAIFHDVADEKDVLRRITAYAQGKVIPGETLVLFDEVQECPEAVTYGSSLSIKVDAITSTVDRCSVLNLRMSDLFPWAIWTKRRCIRSISRSS